MPRPRTWTDEQLVDAVKVSTNLGQVCRLLGISPGKRTYELLRRHIARLGIDSSHLPKVERPRRRRSWTDDDLRAAVAASSSYSDVMRALGYTPSGGVHRYIRSCITELGLDTTHFTGQSWNRGRRYVTGARAIPLEEILVENSTYRPTTRLRRRLIAAGLKENRCEMCGINEWRGSPLPLALDHINGDPSDNRLDNLRIVCPNCHALTETWCRAKSQIAGVAQRQRRSS